MVEVRLFGFSEVNLYRAPRARLGGKELLHGFDPKDYPGRFDAPQPNPDGSVYFRLNDESIAAKYRGRTGYENRILRVTLPREIFETHFAGNRNFGYSLVSIIDAGPQQQLQVPKELFNILNRYGKRSWV